MFPIIELSLHLYYVLTPSLMLGFYLQTKSKKQTKTQTFASSCVFGIKENTNLQYLRIQRYVLFFLYTIFF